MSKSFTIWRQPPILIVQLKRFQYSRTSRRKLHQCVDFPLDHLDLTNYLADSLKAKAAAAVSGGSSSSSSSAVSEADVEGQLELGQDGSSTSSTSTSTPVRYNLYSVIHHLGALGGGHYVNTTRSTRTTLARIEQGGTGSSSKSGEDEDAAGGDKFEGGKRGGKSGPRLKKTRMQNQKGTNTMYIKP